MAGRIDGLRQFYEKAGLVFVFNSLALACGFFKNIILARYVTGAELGLYSLLLAISAFLYPLSLVGQQTALVRFLGNNDPERFNFAHGLGRILVISISIIVVGVLIASKIYFLSVLPIIFLLVVTLSSAVNDLISAVIRPLGRYFLSVVSFSGVNLFHLGGFILLAALGLFSSANVLWLYIIVATIFSTIVANQASRYFKKGNEAFPKSMWRDGAMMFGTDLSMVIISTMDRFLIPKLVSLEALGLYFAISAVMRLFDLAVQSIEFVLLTYVPHLKKKQIVLIAFAVVAGGLILTVSYLFGAPYILSYVFRRQYDHGAYLIPYFCVVGLLRFIYVVPYTVINGRLQAKRLRQLLYTNMSSMILTVVLSALFITWWGLVGAVVANISVWTFRATSAIVIVSLENESTGSRLPAI